MKLNKKDENINFIGALILFATVSLFIYFGNKSSLREIKDNKIYTVGTVRAYTPSRNGRMLKYTFSYKEDAFVGGFKFYGKDDKFDIGKKLLVVFNPANPETNFLIPYSFPDNIYAPPKGWKEPPLSITEEDVMKYLEEKY